MVPSLHFTHPYFVLTNSLDIQANNAVATPLGDSEPLVDDGFTFQVSKSQYLLQLRFANSADL